MDKAVTNALHAGADGSTPPLILVPRGHDLGGGMLVRRVLPAAQQRSVGPFVFFDHFGPFDEHPEDLHDVRPHPHIGLATVTYLFEGAMMHRDSLGMVQRIEPGAINWMTAGRGIVHSERKPDDLRATTYRSHGLQLWVALPREHEEDAPAFVHTSAAEIPECRLPGHVVRVLIGSAFGQTSPVATLVPTLYLDVRADRAAVLSLPASAEERAVYAVEGSLRVAGHTIAPQTMAVLSGAQTTIEAPDGARYVVIGGQALDGPRFMWWNFVSSRRERIEEAKQAWAEERFPAIPGETEFIPLPPS